MVIIKHCIVSLMLYAVQVVPKSISAAASEFETLHLLSGLRGLHGLQTEELSFVQLPKAVTQNLFPQTGEHSKSVYCALPHFPFSSEFVSLAVELSTKLNRKQFCKF